MNVEVFAQPKNINILFIGDSYTKGESVSRVESYPYQLITLLSDNNYKVKDFKVVAETGWSTAQLIEGLKNEKVNFDYDYCFICIGVNNQYRNIEFKVFENELINLINYGKGRAKKVVLISIPNYGYTPFGAAKKEQITKELKNYNNYIKSTSNQLNLDFVNITDISEQNDTNLVADDELHPSSFQYSLWIKAIFKQIFSEK